MKIYPCTSAQPGFAAGRAHLKIRGQFAVSTGSSDPQRELIRLQSGLDELKSRLQNSIRTAENRNAEIIESSLMMLEDESFLSKMRDAVIEGKADAEAAVSMAGIAAAREMSDSSNAYLRERGADIAGLSDQLIACLRGDGNAPLTQPSIIVADELSPSELAGLNAAYILGLVTAKGARTSHVSIFAGNLGVPYIYGADVLSVIGNGDFIIINGDEGTLTIDPDEGTRASARARCQSAQKARSDSAVPETKTRIAANISGLADIPALLSAKAKAVGLFRSEFLFLDSAEEPSEETQFAAYRNVLEAMNGGEVVIRTMDIGSDKRVDWLRLPTEANPALGCRGLRVSLNHPEIFKKQLRALLRAAACGNLRVMLPMVASAWELEEARRQMDIAAAELAGEGVETKMPDLGVMIETPAAVMIADELARKAAFFSIGTNDLTQYTLAIDREAQGLDRYCDPCHESVMRMIALTVEAAHRHGIPVAICGELAGSPAAIRRLVQMGVDELSVSVGRMKSTAQCVWEAERNAPPADESRVPCEIGAPADGDLIAMEEIPDPVFSSGTMGKCVAVLPENGMIYAPCDGKIDAIAPTLHAVTFVADSGDRILLHVGIDTVRLNGEGFQVRVREGEHVARGQHIMDVDLDILKNAGLSSAVVVVWCE